MTLHPTYAVLKVSEFRETGSEESEDRCCLTILLDQFANLQSQYRIQARRVSPDGIIVAGRDNMVV
jgi:hypothetical protein